jgi:hypothetical protein
MHLKMVPTMGMYLPKSMSAEEFFPTKTDLAVKLSSYFVFIFTKSTYSIQYYNTYQGAAV